MKKVTIQIEGMMCGMCEAHINDALRRAFPKAKKVVSSHKKAESSFVIDEEINESSVKEAIENTGYHFQSMQVEPHVKKGLFGRG
ncbi:MAG: heavy-metal-associated domain-containing protein [Ruminococcaceae bacterium]|nr:heavy-metal-associated domain-containing protein [Oscillospiraceae bacterium]